MSIRKKSNCEQKNVCSVMRDLESCEVCASAVPKFRCQSNDRVLVVSCVSFIVYCFPFFNCELLFVFQACCPFELAALQKETFQNAGGVACHLKDRPRQ